MNPRPLALLLFAFSTVHAQTERFDDTPPGQLPAGWLATKTGTGTPHWSVEKDPAAPSGAQVLRQSGTATFPLCLKTDSALQDGFVAVNFKAIAGKEDQAGGVVWRAKDADNYYIARANALEDNAHIYRTVAGRRIQFDGVDVKVTGGAWHTLRVAFHGANFTVFLDGRKILTAKDTTFSAAGMVGLWTKADSVTAFDDFAWGPPAAQ